MNISELKDKELDHAVAKALNWKLVTWGDRQVWVQNYGDGRWRCNEEDWKPSTDWNQGGPIIELKQIVVASYGDKHDPQCEAAVTGSHLWLPGKSYLEAGMRCFVASMFKTNPEYFV